MRKRFLACFVLLFLCTASASVYAAADQKKTMEKQTVGNPAAAAPSIDSVEERRLLVRLSEERKKIQDEKKGIESRKIELKTLEDEVDKKLGRLEALRLEIRKLLAQKKETEKAPVPKKAPEQEQAENKDRIRKLGKVYEKMDPAKAAPIIAALDQDISVALLASMKQKSAAAIMNLLPRETSARLSLQFTNPAPAKATPQGETPANP